METILFVPPSFQNNLDSGFLEFAMEIVLILGWTTKNVNSRFLYLYIISWSIKGLEWPFRHMIYCKSFKTVLQVTAYHRCMVTWNLRHQYAPSMYQHWISFRFSASQKCKSVVLSQDAFCPHMLLYVIYVLAFLSILNKVSFVYICTKIPIICIQLYTWFFTK